MEDKIVLMIILTSCIVPLVILSFVFLSGRGSFLIAGYNTMLPVENKNYDTVSLCKFTCFLSKKEAEFIELLQSEKPNIELDEKLPNT